MKCNYLRALLPCFSFLFLYIVNVWAGVCEGFKAGYYVLMFKRQTASEITSADKVKQITQLMLMCRRITMTSSTLAIMKIITACLYFSLYTNTYLFYIYTLKWHSSVFLLSCNNKFWKDRRGNVVTNPDTTESTKQRKFIDRAWDLFW